MEEINSAKSICSYLLLSHLITLAIGFIGVGVVAWFLSSNIPKFAVVDMQALIAKQSEQLAADPRVKIHGGKVSANKIQEAGNLLREKLEQFARTHQVVLLNKGAVIGSHLPDYTDAIIEELFPDNLSALRKLIQEDSLYHKKTSSIIPKLFSNKQEEHP